MPATATDRIDGLTTSVAVKAPCKYLTTGNITLSGLAVQGGGEWIAPLTAGDRIFVTSQTNPIYDGIYVARTTAWTRARDFDGARDAVQGTLIPVYRGAGTYTIYAVTTADPIRIGESSLTFEQVIDPFLTIDLANTSDTNLGVSLVGGAERVVDSIAALKALSKLTNRRVYVTGNATPGDGFGGHYYYDPSDTTSSNDDYGVVVATDGGRWKIIQANGVKYGNRTVVAGSKMKIDYLLENNPGHLLEDMGGIWVANTYTYYGISKGFISGDGGANAPVAVSFTYAINNGSAADVVAGIDVATANSNTGSKAVFARNLIAGANNGVTNAKMVGLEIDIEPSASATSAGTGGAIFVNGFSVANLGAILQSGGTPGATFNNGILIGNVASTGAAYAALSGLSCNVGMDLTQGTYGQCAISLGPQHRMRHIGNGSTVAADHFSDTGNNFNTSLTAQWLVNAGTNTENTTFFVLRDLAGTASSLITKVATGAAANGAAAVVYVNTNSSTGRSINAGGTINASGADYAEYEIKRDDCGPIAKGQIVGFDNEGKITDQFAQAVSFGIKSTSPNLVGGDTWHLEAGPEPITPIFVAPDIPRPIEPTNSIHKADELYTFEKIEFDNAVAERNTKIQLAHEVWLSTIYAAYLSEHSAWEARHEIERNKVDRIAYCGKVPLDVLGATVGDYVVPVENQWGISAILISNPDFEQYRISVGRVRRILEDGRAEVCVKPI